MMFSGTFGDFEKNQCMSDNLDVVRAENGILRRKLQSKTEGLMILSKEVEVLKNELNQTKTLNEHLINPKSSSELLLDDSALMLYSENTCFSTSSARERNRIALHKQLRKKNYTLQLERENLRQQLDDAKGDIRIFREQVKKAGKVLQRKVDKVEENSVVGKESRESLVKRMEDLQIKHNALKHDLQRLLDEKEDIVREKEDMSIKIHRINHQLQAILKYDKHSLLDIDHILTENRYLTERLARTQDEKELANQMGRRYKEALDKSKRINPIKESNKEHLRGLLKANLFPVPQPVDLDSLGGLEQLCTSLLETLTDRQLQVRHQRAANRELAARLEKLEEKLIRVEGGDILVNPSQVIMMDYKPGNADAIEGNEDAVQERLEEMRNKQNKELLREESVASAIAERPETPDYEDLNKRFENLLNMIGSRDPPEILDDNVFHDEENEVGVVHYSCSKPPDILDFTPRNHPDLDLEEVNITLNGMEIVPSTSKQYENALNSNDYDDDSEQLPDHIQAMVNRAMNEMD
eukprot:GFUD01007634.1.p1 GENE.GFUD01007634.1~~GFUD01007634.1.p1  ORF type:complete len:524 (+),score=163.83 GFUD01007634.1:33-1604(+)